MSQNPNPNQDLNIDPELADLLNKISETKPKIEVPTIVESTPKQPDKVVAVEAVSSEFDDDVIQRGIRDKVLDTNVKILDSCDADRDQIQKTIGILFDKLQYDENPNRAVIEQLVNALRARAEVNDTVVRASETLVKLLSVTKKKETVQRNTLNVTPDALKQMLKDD